ncbi:glycosyl hydrolase family 18 protein [Aggregatilinea lenta]|uniref:glycosyl hydrolase family 18 protein n=1 Tax=Aggregatilinea lenta TaxID=913108 RepID=UPI000E5B2953|nr:glycosyl hydrolase family 18 protein [Aggregatilinea lenta]
MNRLRAFLIAAIAGIALARSCVFRPATDYPGIAFNRDTNAVWLGVEWVNEPRAPGDVADLVEDLRRHRIRTVFVYTSYMRADGTFNTTYDHAAGFVHAVHALDHTLDVLAWIGLPLDVPRSSGTVDLGDGTTRQRVVALCTELIAEAGFDGVHLDPEPVPGGDDTVLALLEDVRQSLPPDAMLSIATRRIWPVFPDVPWPGVGAGFWRSDYYRQIAAHVDQIALMTYDSALPVAWMYRQWTRYQVITLSRALENSTVEILIGIPTSEEATRTHRPQAETMESGLRGTIDGLNDEAARPERIAGVAIYPYWETDVDEWRVYDRLWLGREE